MGDVRLTFGGVWNGEEWGRLVGGCGRLRGGIGIMIRDLWVSGGSGFVCGGGWE